MNMKKYLIRTLLPILLLGATGFTACVDDIEIGGEIDERPWDGIYRIDGVLLDRNSNENQNVVDLESTTHKLDLYFQLTQLPRQGVDVVVDVDAEYVKTYNEAHGTDYELYPRHLVKIENDGAMLLAPDETQSTELGVELTVSEELAENTTYVLPLSITSLTEGITLTESAQHAVYLVRMPDKESLFQTCDKGPDAVKTVLFLEVNNENPLNALEFVLKDSGKLFFDHVVLFAANINYDAQANRVYLKLNPETQALLNSSERFIQPLRKRGIKVILCVLGNHDMAGVSQLSTIGARQFAQDLANAVKTYKLDGVGFDDEYSKTPDLSNPLFVWPSEAAAGRLLFETKKLMPDKIVMVYYMGNMSHKIPMVEGFQPSVFVDYAVNDYLFGAAPPMAGMTEKNCAGASVNLGDRMGETDEEQTRKIKERGYGYYMLYNLKASDQTVFKRQVDMCQTVSRGLYDEELLRPTQYYLRLIPKPFPVKWE